MAKEEDPDGLQDPDGLDPHGPSKTLLVCTRIVSTLTPPYENSWA
jgi:hypothetical protein